MPFHKIKVGKNRGKYRSPSGRLFTPSQVRRYYARGGTFDAGFNPNQPRKPAGSPEGGEWTETILSRGSSHLDTRYLKTQAHELTTRSLSAVPDVPYGTRAYDRQRRDRAATSLMGAVIESDLGARLNPSGQGGNFHGYVIRKGKIVGAIKYGIYRPEVAYLSLLGSTYPGAGHTLMKKAYEQMQADGVKEIRGSPMVTSGQFYQQLSTWLGKPLQRHPMGPLFIRLDHLYRDAQSRKDPTQTAGIRRALRADLKRRFAQVTNRLRELLVDKGLFSTGTGLLGMADSQLKVFQHWFDAILQQMVLQDGAWLTPYLLRGHRQGVHRGERLTTGIVGATQETASALLSVSAFMELQGMVEAISQHVMREMAQSLLRNTPQNVTFRRISERIQEVGKKRVDAFASTIVVRAHANGTLDAFARLGVNQVGVLAESHLGKTGKIHALFDAPRRTPSRRSRQARSPSTIRRREQEARRLEETLSMVKVETAGDDRVCPICEDIEEGGPYDLDTARSLIPAHPNCRCAYIPYGYIPTQARDPQGRFLAEDAGFDPSQPRVPAGSPEGGEWTEFVHSTQAGKSPLSTEVLKAFETDIAQRSTSLRLQPPPVEAGQRAYDRFLRQSAALHYMKAVVRRDINQEDRHPSQLFKPYANNWYGYTVKNGKLVAALTYSIVQDVGHMNLLGSTYPGAAHPLVMKMFENMKKEGVKTIVGSPALTAGSFYDILAQYKGLSISPSDPLYGKREVRLDHRDAGFNPDQPRDPRGQWTKGSAEIRVFLEAIAGHQAHLKARGMTTPAQFQLDHGKSYPFGPHSFAGEREAQHECFKNAGRMALEDPSLTYVEGYVSVHGVPLEHAWVIDPQGRVIDPTISVRPGDTSVKGYYGVPIRTDYLRRTVLQKGTWGVLAHDNFKYLQEDPDAIVSKRPVHDAYNPSQPRVPAGSPEGGQWTEVHSTFPGGSPLGKSELFNYRDDLETRIANLPGPSGPIGSREQQRWKRTNVALALMQDIVSADLEQTHSSAWYGYALSNNQVVGAVKYEIHGRAGFIETLAATHPGAGHALFRKAIDAMKAKGVWTVRGVVAPTAGRFYERMARAAGVTLKEERGVYTMARFHA